MDLPQTIRDAVIVTHRLGLRYLWVDCLCIIQDSKEDKDREVAQMHNIYRNASFTISATNARSAYSGFLNHRYDDTASQKLPLYLPGGQLGNMYVRQETIYGALGTLLETRAWCLEEGILSPRLLDYRAENLTWRCNEVFDYDGRGTDTYFPDRSNLELISLLRASPEKLGELDKSRKIRRFWSYVIGNYTGRELTKQKDKLPALGGLAVEFQRHIGGDYVAGLWSKHLAAGLLWNGLVQPTSEGRQGAAWDDPTILYRPQTFRAPSWSWASIEGRVDSWDFQIFERSYEEGQEKVEITLEVLNYDVPLKSSAVPYGQVIGGTLTVMGYLRTIDLRNGQNEVLEIKVGNARIVVDPDDLHEWAAAFDSGTLYLLEILRRSEKVQSGSVVWNFSLGDAEASRSRGLMLVKSASGRYRRLGHFRQMDMQIKGTVFQDVKREKLVIE